MMKKMKLVELMISVCALLGFLFLCKSSLDMPKYKMFWTGPGAIPSVLCGFLAFFSLCWTVDIIRQIKKDGMVSDTIRSIVDRSTQKSEWMRLGVIALLTLLYVYLLTPLVGFPLATLIFLVVSICLFGEMRWWKSLSAGVFVSVLVYSAFKYILHLPMPR